MGSCSNYYGMLGVGCDASVAEIRSAYHKQAMKWHPDKCQPWMVEEANRRFHQIHEAYQVLSDERKRRLYDTGLHHHHLLEEEEEEEVEGFSEYIAELLNMTESVRREEKEYTIGELQQMMSDMMQKFNSERTPTPLCR